MNMDQERETDCGMCACVDILYNCMWIKMSVIFYNHIQELYERLELLFLIWQNPEDVETFIRFDI